MQDYRNLTVWNKAHGLAPHVYEATASFPKEERYALTSQLRRSAVSIGSNIAEGSGRSGNGDFGRFLHMAFGSACELEYQLLLARDLKFLPNEKQVQLLANINEVKRMLGSLLTKVKGDA
jgi:four helix bundle protein